MPLLNLTMFGLRVRSEIEHPDYILNLLGASRCDETTTSAETADVVVSYGRVADRPEPDLPAVTRTISPMRTCIHLRGMGTVDILDGRQIVVDPDPGADAEGLSLCVFGMAFAYILLQRDLTPLHASAIELNGQVIALLGQGGQGKSSTAAVLRERGHRVIADDLIAVSLAGPVPQVIGQDLPHLKIWANAAAPMGISTADALPLRDGVARMSKPRGRVDFVKAPLAACIQLEFGGNVRDPVLVPVARLEAMMLIRTHIFGHRHVGPLMGEAWLLARQASLVQHLDYVRLRRPRDPGRIDECIDLVEGFLSRLPRLDEPG